MNIEILEYFCELSDQRKYNYIKINLPYPLYEYLLHEILVH